MKKIAVLLDGGIANDGRVRRVVNSFSEQYEVDLFYCGGSEKDKDLFLNKNIRLFQFSKSESWLKKNLFFNKKFDGLIECVLNTEEKYQLIYCNDYPLLQTAVLLKEKLTSRLVYDSHEIYIKTINQFFPTTGLSSIIYGKFLIALNTIYHSLLEKKYIKEVDLMVTVCESFANYFKQKFDLNNVVVLKNCPLISNRISKTNKLKEKIGLPTSDKILLYQGVINPGRGLKELIESAKFFDKNTHLVILGFGPSKLHFQEMTKDLGLVNVHFVDKVSFDELLYFTSSADIGILLIESFNLSKQLTLPNKVFEYMAAGIPFITNKLPEASKIAIEENCGYIIDDSTPEVIAKEINSIMRNLDREKGINGQNAIQNKYNWKSEFEGLSKELEKLFVEKN
jgi:glycosyltransferase involved in cell wall biosynthesis